VLGIRYEGRFKIHAFRLFPYQTNDAIKDASRYPPGFILQVNYNPHKPQEAITQYDGEDSAILAVIITIFIIGVISFLASIFSLKY
jgi:hypothetical protein